VKQVSFLHTADLHLDAPFSSLGDEAKACKRRNELESCLCRIIQRVQEAGINILIISGDLFEDKYIKGSTILKIKNLFTEIYNTEIVIIPGNHDLLRENSFYRTTVWGSNVHILEDSKQVLYLEKYNTCIYNLGVKNNVRMDMEQIPGMEIARERFNILLLHGTVDIPFEEDNYNSITSKELLSLNMDYIALGHMHCYSELKNESTVMVNPGSPEPLGFDEEGEHGYVQGLLSISEDCKKQCDIRFIEDAARHYHNIDVNISGCSDDSEVIEKICPVGQMDGVGQFSFRETDFYKITLTGFISKNYSPDIGYIQETLNSRCFYIKLRNQTSAKFEYECYLEDPGIKGEFVRRILDLQEGEGSQEKRDTLFLAMQYGLQALENERVD
jgi:DNA repair protein SbcD/Mre11